MFFLNDNENSKKCLTYRSDLSNEIKLLFVNSVINFLAVGRLGFVIALR